MGQGGSAAVVVVRGPNFGASFTVREVTILGRRDDCDIILDDVSVSRRHAMAAPDGATLMIEDLGSLNGPFVDDHRIEQATTVSHGQSLLVGRYRLIVVGAAYDDDLGAATA